MSDWLRNHNPAPSKNCPCMDCPKRELGCHGKCPAYATFKAEVEEIRERERTRTKREYYSRLPRAGKRR